MKGFEFLTAPMAQAIGWALLHLLWQGALVGGIAAAGLALLRNRSANARYALACAAMAVLPVLAVVTAMRSYEPPVTMAAVDTARLASVSHATTPAPAAVETPAPAPLLPPDRRSSAAWSHAGPHRATRRPP